MTCIVVVSMAGVVFSQAAAALNAPAATPFRSNQIRLSSDSTGHAMFEDVSMAPGQTVTSSMDVAFEGDDAPAEIRLYGSTSGGRFARALELEVVRGQRVLYLGSLADFPDRYETGVIDPGWHASTSASYRFRISVTRGARTPKGTATQSFTWEARTA